jgi:hypothetical protein
MDEEEFEQPIAMDPEDDEYESPSPPAPDSSNTDDLEDLAAQYGIPGPREAYAQLAMSAENARSNLKQARERILARKYSNAGAWFAASAALGAPTRTGSIGEAFSNLSTALAPVSRDRQEFEQQRDKDLMGVDTDISGIDERMAMNSLKLAQMMKKGAPGHTPSAIQVFEYFRNLDPEGFAKLTPQEKQTLMLETMRNPNFWTGNVAGSVVTTDESGRRPDRVHSTLAQEEHAKERISGAQSEGEAIGKTVADAKQSLPAAETAASYITQLLDDLKKHPGKKWVVGWPEGINLGRVAHTSAMGFQTRLDQIKGKQFLTAYQALRGAGAITVEEGTRAGEAEARMRSAQRQEDFDAALEEYKAIVRDGLENLRQRAAMRDENGGRGGTDAPSSKPPVESGRVYNYDKNGRRL